MKIQISAKFFFIIICFFPAVVSATGNLTISPSKKEITAPPGSSTEYFLTINNETDTALNLLITAEDFVPNNLSADSPLHFLGDELGPYSLKNYLDFDRQPFRLPAKSQKNIPIKIILNENVSPGGYYAAIFVKLIREQTTPSAEALIATRLGSLLFLAVSGSLTYQGELLNFDFRRPNFQISFNNQGNVHLNPYGLIKIESIFSVNQSKMSSTITVDPWFVLPKSTRLREIAWPNFDQLGFGYYQTILTLNRGYDDLLDTETVNFWVIPLGIKIVGGLLAIFLLLILFLIVKSKKGRAKSIVTSVALLLWFIMAETSGAYVAGSANYRIQSDSLNFSGARSSSNNYSLEDTAGEAGTGISTSANYQILAGYQQMLTSSLSISVPSDVTLSPSLNGIAAGTANGSASWTVITDNAAGYTMSIKSSTNPALQTGSQSISNYAPSGANPDYSWSVGSNDAEFGYTVEGTNTTSRFLDNGTACGSGASNQSDACWDGFSTTAVTIASASSANSPSGTATTVKFRAEIGADKVVEQGNYSAAITVTATAL